MSTAVERPCRARPVLRARSLMLVCAFAGAASAGEPASLDADFGDAGASQVSVPVLEGTYRVTVRMKGARKTTGTLLAEQRRLMIDDIRFQDSKPVERTVIVDVRRPELDTLPVNATGGTRVRLKPREVGSASWDEQLSLQLMGGQILSLHAVPATVPVLYLAGDSTVTDQATAPGASWGQFLTRYFANDMAVANHAESGETLKSFVTEQRLDKLLSKLKAGDWVMIQFGHNDQKIQWPQTYAEAAGTYRSWLRVYIAEIRRRGATPLLVTSPERRNFDEHGRITVTLGDYPDAVRAVAHEERVALIDLNPLSVRLYEALGPDLAPRAFADEGRDKTHHNEYGARQLARAIIEALRATDPALTAGLETHIAADAGRFDAAHPPLPK